MSRLVRRAVLALILCSATAAPFAQSNQMGGLGIGVYEDSNYRGMNATFLRDTPDLSDTGLLRRISSLRVAPGEVWEVCTEPNYRGRCQVFSGDESNLARVGWNDAIASLRRVRGRGSFPGGGVIGGGRGSAGLEFYAGLQYSGQRKVIDEAVDNFRDVDFNDRAMSVRVPRGEVWEICVNADYDDCRLIDSDIPNLAAIGLSRMVSSARPRPGLIGRGGRGRGPQPQPNRVVLYEDRNFGGQAFVVTTTMTQLRGFNDKAGSARVEGGNWELCEDDRFGGRCVTITQDVSDLRRLGLNDKVSSVRPR